MEYLCIMLRLRIFPGSVPKILNRVIYILEYCGILLVMFREYWAGISGFHVSEVTFKRW
jgi:hypothetical protein